jgi:hypothetical protein
LGCVSTINHHTVGYWYRHSAGNRCINVLILALARVH